MPSKNGHDRQNEENFKHTAVEFLNKNGGGVEASDTRVWKRKRGAHGKPAKALNGMAQLRAENEALRNQIVSLQVQWETLKSTLGVLSTTICSHDTV
jgi:hypothetical protein